MDSKLKADWIAALRSGEFKQCQYMLSNTRGEHCALGVLQRIAPTTHIYRLVSTELWQSCADLNDIKQLSFPQIADWLESNPDV